MVYVMSYVWRCPIIGFRMHTDAWLMHYRSFQRFRHVWADGWQWLRWNRDRWWGYLGQQTVSSWKYRPESTCSIPATSNHLPRLCSVPYAPFKLGECLRKVANFRLRLVGKWGISVPRAILNSNFCLFSRVFIPASKYTRLVSGCLGHLGTIKTMATTYHK